MPPRSPLGPLLHWLLLGGLLGLALLLVISRPLPTNDYSIYVAMGRQMLASGFPVRVGVALPAGLRVLLRDDSRVSGAKIVQR